MDTLDDDSIVEIYRRVADTNFRLLAPLLLVDHKQSSIALSDGVLRHLSLREFFNNPEMVQHDSPYRGFFKKCVAAHNPIATYLESLRIACKIGDFSQSVALLLATAPESDYATFARGLMLIYSRLPADGLSTLSNLLTRLGNMPRLRATAEVVYRHVMMLHPVDNRVFSNIQTLGLLPPCSGNSCQPTNQCLYCFLYWLIVRFNTIL